MKIGYINLALELKRRGVLKNTSNVYDMGSKELRISYNDLKNKFNEYKIKFNSKDFEELRRFPKGKRISTKFFWKNIGIKNYYCSDINYEQNSKFLDLNYPIKKITKQYDLINDFGNNEHAFNIAQAYENMFNLCKVDGHMWISQSLYGGNGFYNFDPSFFEGMAAANNLGVIYSAFVVNIEPYKQFFMPCDKEMLKGINLNKVINIDVTYILKKRQNKKFKYFYQYNINNNQNPYLLTFDHGEHFAEKFYIPTKNLKEIKKLAKKGNVVCIEWLRSNKIKF